jgi:hypothetical protein
MAILPDEVGMPYVGMPSEVVWSFLPDEIDRSCLFCIVLAALPFPDAAEGSSEHCCAFHRRVLRQLQCLGWNTDHDHQVLAGQARAQQFTPEYQQAAAFASWAAFSARWRASQGLGPLSAEAVRKYLTPEQIRGPLGLPLRPDLQATIYRAWRAGELRHVAAWLGDDPPPDPDGLWAAPAHIQQPTGDVMSVTRREVGTPQTTARTR